MADGDNIRVGGVGVEVDPIGAPTFFAKFAAQALPGASKAGEELGKALAAPIAQKVGDAIVDGISRNAKTAAARAGEQSGAEFARAFTARVEAALKALPDAKVGIDGGKVDKDLAAIRAKLQALSGEDARIDVDVADEDSVGRLDTVRRAVRSLAKDIDTVRVGAEKPIRIDIDVAEKEAVARLDIVRRAVSSLARDLVKLREAGEGIKVDVDTAGSTASLVALAAEMRLLRRELERKAKVDIDGSPAAASVRSVGSAASSAIPSIGLLAGAGIALGPAIIPVAAAVAAALAAIGPAALIGAYGIGTTILGFSGISGALGAMSKAQDSAVGGGGSLLSQQNALASAHDQLRNAIQSETQSQRDLLQAQQDLNRARQEAARDLEDLNAQLRGNSLDQRQAALDLKAAKDALTAANTVTIGDRIRAIQSGQPIPTADPERVAQAQLALEQAQQRVEDLARAGRRLATDQAAAAAAGVEGSDKVRAAQERISAAQEQLIRDTQQVAAAHRQLQAAAESAGGGGAAAMDQLAKAMAGLSPAGQRFVKFLFGLKDEFRQLKFAAQEGLLPGVQAGIEALLPTLPKLTDFVGKVAGAMGDLFRRAGQALASPFWQKFFDMLDRIAVPVLETVGSVVGDFAKGLAGLFEAFLPFGEDIGQGLIGFAEDFAKWGTTLKDNPEFQKFLAYVREHGPKVVDLVKDLVGAIGNIAVALAPYGTIVLDTVDDFFEMIKDVDPVVLQGIAAGVAAIIGALASAKAGPLTVIVGIGAAILLVIKHWDELKDKVKQFLDPTQRKEILEKGQALFDNFLDKVKEFGGKLVDKLNTTLKETNWAKVGRTIGDAIVDILKFTQENGQKFTSTIIDLLGKINWVRLSAALALLGGQISAAIFLGMVDHATENVKNAADEVIDKIVTGVTDGFNAAKDALVEAARSVFRAMIDGVKSLLGIKSPSTVFTDIARDIIQGLINGITGGVPSVGSAVTSAINKVRGAFGDSGRWLVDAGKGLIRGLQDGAASVLSQVAAQISGSVIGKIGAGLAGVLAKGFADGGYTGEGGRLEPAGVVHRNEYVIPSAAVNAFGVGYFDDLIGRRSSGIPRQGGYADGGWVPSGGVGYRSGQALAAPAAAPAVQAAGDGVGGLGTVQIEHFHAEGMDPSDVAVELGWQYRTAQL